MENRARGYYVSIISANYCQRRECLASKSQHKTALRINCGNKFFCGKKKGGEKNEILWYIFFEIQFHITHLAAKEINAKLKVLYLISTSLNLLKFYFKLWKVLGLGKRLVKLFPISGSTLLLPLSTDKSKDRREQVGSLTNNMEYTLYPTKLFRC